MFSMLCSRVKVVYTGAAVWRCSGAGRGSVVCFCGGGQIFSAGADYCDDDDADPVTSHSVVKRLRQRRRTVALYMATPFRKVHLWCTV